MNLLIILSILFFLFLIFSVFLIFSKYTESYNSYKFSNKSYIPYNLHKNVKILNLVLYSNGKSYDKMYNITRKYYSKFYPEVLTIYYLFDENINEPIVKNDILLIPGKESYIPGILDKTIKAMELTKNIDYKYLLRSNISTIVNMKNLLNYLNKNKNIEYGGSWKMTHIRKGFRDPQNGINDDRYDGLDFISGTGIVLSKKIVEKILENRDKIDYSIVDDVSIGYFLQKNTNIKPISFDLTISYEDINKSNDNLNLIFYRNRSLDRENDVKNMQKIVDLLN
jgi:hypothetical protein